METTALVSIVPRKLYRDNPKYTLEASTKRLAPELTYLGTILLTVLIVCCPLFTETSFSEVVAREQTISTSRAGFEVNAL